MPADAFVDADPIVCVCVCVCVRVLSLYLLSSL